MQVQYRLINRLRVTGDGQKRKKGKLENQNSIADDFLQQLYCSARATFDG